MAPNRLALSPVAPARLAIEEYVLGVEARGHTLIGGNDPNSVFTEASQKEKVPAQVFIAKRMVWNLFIVSLVTVFDHGKGKLNIENGSLYLVGTLWAKLAKRFLLIWPAALLVQTSLFALNKLALKENQ
ncbi:uncharacterized protein L3040_001012 [Drepanopeziza brunnea f. sp. 'multigermtubi']|uniref:uncharacterized protein n=1 Tax=Drepanopeziza brunnea f. sp. 'multigermtubi' TaxID=698441 RepID=UPI00238C8AEB|nr:hypothetical protein L3040_001012 [Drepanopeziza brunnea f. sp. 'multigermtubi']